MEAYGIATLGDVDLLVYFFALVKDVLLLVVKAGLQTLQQLYHELLKSVVLPTPKPHPLKLTIAFLLDQPQKVRFKQVHEILEQKIFVNVSPDVLRQLFHETHVLWGLDSVILVVLPVILKILFETFDHGPIQGSAFVEMCQQSQPLGQVF